MSQAASWFLLVMFVALCAVVMTVLAQRSPHMFGAENFSDSADYDGPDTRQYPEDMDIEDPDADELSPDESPENPLTAPSELALRGMDTSGDMESPDMPDMDEGEEANMDDDTYEEGNIEPFVGEEYEAF